MQDSQFPVQRTVEIVQGRRLRIAFDIKNKNGTATDLTGSSFRARVSQSWLDEPVASFAVTFIAYPGSVEAILSPAITASLAPGSYSYEVVWVDTADTPRTVDWGTMIVMKGAA